MQTATWQLIFCAKPFQIYGIRYPIFVSLQCRRQSVSIIYINAHVGAAGFQPDHISVPSGHALPRQVEKIRTKVFPKFHQPTDRGACESFLCLHGQLYLPFEMQFKRGNCHGVQTTAYADYPVETTSIGTVYRMGVEISYIYHISMLKCICSSFIIKMIKYRRIVRSYSNEEENRIGF